MSTFFLTLISIKTFFVFLDIAKLSQKKILMEDRLEWIWVSNSSEARSGSRKKSQISLMIHCLEN